MLRRLPYSLVSRALGVLLLAAAGLKLNGMAVDPVGRMGLFTLPAFQVAVVQFEIFLSIWLLSGQQPLGSWVTAFGVFTVFAGVTAYQGWIGRASCGCFGQLSMSPWYAFGIDVAILLGLILGRPDLESVRRQPRRILLSVLPAGYGVGGAAVILLSLTGLANLVYGSSDAAIARIRGERISIYPRLVDFGTGDPKEEREESFEIVNRTDRPIRVVGGTKE